MFDSPRWQLACDRPFNGPAYSIINVFTLLCAILCALVACDADTEPKDSNTDRMPATDMAATHEDAGDEAPAAATPPVKKPGKQPGKATGMDAAVALDAAATDPDEDAGTDAGLDAGDTALLDGSVNVTLSDAATPGLRSLTIELSGWDGNLNRFMQFRAAPPDNSWQIMAVIHEGVPTPSYRFELPNSLLADVDYRLDFWVDTDQSGGYNRPPTDHAWSLPLSAGTADIVIDFPHNTNFTDIERMPPIHDSSLLLSATHMFMYAPRLIDVRAIERGTGRLSGRQLREIPGDEFVVTVGSVIHGGLEYDVVVTIDENNDGKTVLESDPTWHIAATANDEGLRVPFSPDLPH
jgi:hypothetical protein